MLVDAVRGEGPRETRPKRPSRAGSARLASIRHSVIASPPETGSEPYSAPPRAQRHYGRLRIYRFCVAVSATTGARRWREPSSPARAGLESGDRAGMLVASEADHRQRGTGTKVPAAAMTGDGQDRTARRSAARDWAARRAGRGAVRPAHAADPAPAACARGAGLAAGRRPAVLSQRSGPAGASGQPARYTAYRTPSAVLSSRQGCHSWSRMLGTTGACATTPP